MSPVKLEPIQEPTTFRSGPRWPWEATGRVYVLACGNVLQHELTHVASTIRGLLKEFAIPLIVTVERGLKRTKAITPLITQTRQGKQLDNQLLVTRINEERKTSQLLGPGLVILLAPSEFDCFQRPWETQPGVYGTTHDDGVSLLRCYKDAAVRHEFAHMLGLEPHHDEDPNCEMNWRCQSNVFCPSCANKLRSIVRITDE